MSGLFSHVCAPAVIFFIYALIQIILDIFKKLYNQALIKYIIMIIFTWLLNILCKSGLGIVSWILVFIPFILMTVITALLLFLFKLDPKTGNIETDNNDIIIENEVVFGESHAVPKEEELPPPPPVEVTNEEAIDQSKEYSKLADEISESSNKAAIAKQEADMAKQEADKANQEALEAEKEANEALKELNDLDENAPVYHQHDDLPNHTHDSPPIESYNNIYNQRINAHTPIKLNNTIPAYNINIETFINNIRNH